MIGKAEVGKPVAVRYSDVKIVGRITEINDGQVVVMTPFGNSIEVEYSLAYQPTKDEELTLAQHEKSAKDKNLPVYNDAIKRKNGKWVGKN